MKTSTAYLLCLLGLALLNQGKCRPSEEPTDDYVQDGEVDDYDEEDEDSGPPPTVKSQPLTLDRDINGSVVFPCEIDRNPEAFSRVWRKDSDIGLFTGSLKQSNNDRISLLRNGALEVRHLNPSDAGLYSCMVGHDQQQEVVHTLRVRSPAKIIGFSPRDAKVSLKLGSSLTLECKVQGFPTPVIKWYRNDHVLESQGPSIQGASYTITNASSEDAGFYKCRASAPGQQKPAERSIEVQVNYPPQIKIAKEVVTTGEGYDSELRCTVFGNKDTQVTWFKDGERNPIESHHKRFKIVEEGNEHILKISKTQHTDFGEYSCEAKNSEGSTSAVIRLTGKPSRPVLQSSDEEKESKNPVLVFKTESLAPIEKYELLYKKDSMNEWSSVNPIVEQSTDGRTFSMTYTFTDLEPGVYVAQVKAKNSYGWSEFSSETTFPREHDSDLTETGSLAVADSSAAELRISFALVASLLVARFYC